MQCPLQATPRRWTLSRGAKLLLPVLLLYVVFCFGRGTRTFCTSVVYMYIYSVLKIAMYEPLCAPGIPVPSGTCTLLNMVVALALFGSWAFEQLSKHKLNFWRSKRLQRVTGCIVRRHGSTRICTPSLEPRNPRPSLYSLQP